MDGPSLAALVLALVSGLQAGRREEAIEEFKRERVRVQILSGQRHLEYGLELRDKGLTTQAAAQIVLAVEVSHEHNEQAELVLGLLRRYGDDFWKRKLTRPSSARIEAYEKDALELRVEDQSDRLGLVRWAEKKRLDQHAFEELRGLLLELDEPLVFDAGGALVLPGGRVSPALAERLRSSAIEINGRPYVRDLFLERLPELSRFFEQSSPELRVRSTTSLDEAEALHAATTALLPVLREDLGATPGRRLQIVVLGRRKLYQSYLDMSGLSKHRAADGFADRVAGTAVLCSEGCAPDYLLGLALHELAHLFQLSVSPASFPSWYMEASAETYGGEGVFRWDGARLETRGVFAPARLAEVRAAPLPLGELLSGDALELLASDRAAARRFYAQSWAFLRFLEQGAGEEVAAHLDRWRA